MNMHSGWDWASGFPSVPADALAGVCHLCRPLWEASAARAMRGLETRMSDAGIADLEAIYPDLRMIHPMARNEVLYLNAQLSRIKRISGLYAGTFKALDRIGVQIPFVGAAAFASNVVRWEVEDLIRGLSGQIVLMERSRMRSDASPFLIPIRDTLNKVIQGNAVVFVEIFAIFDFCLRHFQKFGVPRSPALITEFDLCLKEFITWWDRVQPAGRAPGLRDIRVDRSGLIREGIIASLRATTSQERISASVDKILFNEQMFTLQEYMYDRIQIGPIDMMEIGLVLRGYRAAAQFSYTRDPVPDRFIVTFNGPGWLTVAAERYPYTKTVVSRFGELYSSGGADRRALEAAHMRMEADAHGY